jgi:hypothetical protein
MGPQNGGYRCVVRPQGRLKPRPYGRRKMAHNPSTTIRHRTYRRMERFDLIYFEQPVEGISRLAEVARAIDAPVMADESAWNAHDVIEIIDKRAAQIVSLYTTKPGGLYRAMEVAAVARAVPSSHSASRARVETVRKRGRRGGRIGLLFCCAA